MKIYNLGKERKKKKKENYYLIRKLQNNWINYNGFLLHKVEMIGHNCIRLWNIIYRKVKSWYL